MCQKFAQLKNFKIGTFCNILISRRYPYRSPASRSVIIY